MKKTNIITLFSSIINGYKTNKKLIKIKRTVFIFKLLKFLYNEGYIFGFYTKTTHSNYILIELKYNLNGFSFIFFLKNFSTKWKKNESYISLKFLKKRFRDSNKYVLSTTRGIINGYTAISYNLGGILLFKIN